MSNYPVTVDEAVEHLRLGPTVDDEEWLSVEQMISAATALAESICSRSWMQTTKTVGYSRFPDSSWPKTGQYLLLPGGEVSSITSLKYYDTSDPPVEKTLGSSLYRLVTGYGLPRVYPAMGESWPTDANSCEPDHITITYVVGDNDVLDVPAPVKSAILLIVGSLYEYREDGVIDNAGLALVRAPVAAKDLLHPYKMRIA